MMDEFDKLVKLPSREEILGRIDEYTLYRYYTEIEGLTPGKPYHSPIRTDKPDTIASFSVFYASKGRGWDDFMFTWKDHGLGKAGNIFELIRILYGFTTYQEVYNLINQDFSLDLSLPSIQAEKINLYECPDPIDAEIRVRDIPLSVRGTKFWEQFRIGRDLLDFYHTGQTDCYWAYPGQAVPSGVLDPTFYYQIGRFYQIYSPYAQREFKFRNNLPENYFFGYLQLPERGEELIIDKSAKDVIFDRRLGYWAVTGKAETTMIPHHKMLELHERFPIIWLTLDPDPAGKRMTEKYLEAYPWLRPRFLTQAKDKTDLCKAVGFDQAEQIIKQTLQ